MDSKGIAQSVIVAAGLIGGLGLLGSQLSDGINAFVDRDRVVTVKGLATASVIADEVLWPISFRVLGNDLQEVYRQAEARCRLSRSFSSRVASSLTKSRTPAPRLTTLSQYVWRKQARVPLHSDAVSDRLDEERGRRACSSAFDERADCQGVTPTEDYSFRTIFNYTN